MWGDGFWDVDVHDDVEVARWCCLVFGGCAETLAAEAEFGAGLCAGWDGECERAFDGWYTDFGSEYGVVDGDGDAVGEVFAFECEAWVWCDVDAEADVAGLALLLWCW